MRLNDFKRELDEHMLALALGHMLELGHDMELVQEHGKVQVLEDDRELALDEERDRELVLVRGMVRDHVGVF